MTRLDELSPASMRTLLACLEREVDENSAEEDPKGDDR